jgi:hypothetical protein
MVRKIRTQANSTPAQTITTAPTHLCSPPQASGVWSSCGVELTRCAVEAKPESWGNEREVSQPHSLRGEGQTQMCRRGKVPGEMPRCQGSPVSYRKGSEMHCNGSPNAELSCSHPERLSHPHFIVFPPSISLTLLSPFFIPF